MSTIRISQSKEELDVDMIHTFLQTTYWAEGRTRSAVETTIKNSICFGAYLDDQQIGFARVVSDHTIFAYMMDVFILPTHRGNGYGVALVNHIMTNSGLNEIQNWMLATDTAHGLYQKFGFHPLAKPENMLRRLFNK